MNTQNYGDEEITNDNVNNIYISDSRHIACYHPIRETHFVTCSHART